jgi:hypothetical protein
MALVFTRPAKSLAVYLLQAPWLRRGARRRQAKPLCCPAEFLRAVFSLWEVGKWRDRGRKLV